VEGRKKAKRTSVNERQQQQERGSVRQGDLLVYTNEKHEATTREKKKTTARTEREAGETQDRETATMTRRREHHLHIYITLSPPLQTHQTQN